MTPVGSEVGNRPLYGAFFGLNESPFELTPNPRFLFLTNRQREALSNLLYGLSSARGLTVITGEAGTGKTTLIRTALSKVGGALNENVLINNPTLNRAEFYEYLTDQLGLPPEAARSKTRFLRELQRRVETTFAAGGVMGLIIDEAQSLPHELLEEIRLLGNIETPTTKLLNIVLSGQPELAERLNETSLRQLKQRVALRCELRPLTLEESAAYMSGRIRIAGGLPQDVFTRESVIAIHHAARGIPRTINVLCDNALVSGFAAQVRPIPLGIVEDACRDFDLQHGVRTTSAAVAPSQAVVSRPSAEGPDAADRALSSPGNQQKPRRRFSFFS